MLVSVFWEGIEPKPENLRLHFETAPAVGDLVEIEGKLMVVSQAWHRPDDACVGSKFAVVLRQEKRSTGRLGAAA